MAFNKKILLMQLLTLYPNKLRTKISCSINMSCTLYLAGWIIMSKKLSKAEGLEQHKKILREKALKKKEKKKAGLPAGYSKNKK